MLAGEMGLLIWFMDASRVKKVSIRWTEVRRNRCARLVPASEGDGSANSPVVDSMPLVQGLCGERESSIPCALVVHDRCTFGDRFRSHEMDLIHPNPTHLTNPFP